MNSRMPIRVLVFASSALALFLHLSASLLGQIASAQTTPSAHPSPKLAEDSAAYSVEHAQIDPHSKSIIAGTSYLLPKPIFPVSARKDGSYTVEYVFNYAKYDYTPTVKIQAVTKADASYATPEQAFTAFYSAIQSLDYDWMVNSWDNDSKKFIVASNEKQKQGSSYWVGLWKQRYVGKRIEMVQRIESGLYVLILYRVIDPATGKEIEQDTVNFNLEGKKWLATQALAADPFSVTYPDLKAGKEETVLLTPDRRPPDPNIPEGIGFPTRDGAQQVFLKDYPKDTKAGVKLIER